MLLNFFLRSVNFIFVQLICNLHNLYLYNMNENIFGLIILFIIIGLIGYFYSKNKKENKDDYNGISDGSGNIPG